MAHRHKKEHTIKPVNNRDNRRDMGPRINNRITAKTVQVISSDGQNLGEMQTSAAIQMALDSGMDLVELNGNATPPVAKIMDFLQETIVFRLFFSVTIKNYSERISLDLLRGIKPKSS